MTAPIDHAQFRAPLTEWPAFLARSVPARSPQLRAIAVSGFLGLNAILWSAGLAAALWR